MRLLLDIGNTRVKWRYGVEAGVAESGMARHTGSALPSELAATVARWPRLDRVVIANVAGAVMEDVVIRWVEGTWGIEADLVEVESGRFGVICGYADPGQFGVDRWLALIAARMTHRGPACVVDCGTAVTVDALSAEGLHIGGVIFPGIRLMRLCLATETGELPTVEGTGAGAFLGRSTQECILNGTLLAVVSAINHLRTQVEAQLGGEVQFYLTGGDAERVERYLVGKYRHVRELVLDGLAVIESDAN